MSTFSIRFTEDEKKLFKSYASFTGKPLSKLLKTALKEQIEDKLDLRIDAPKTLEEFEKDPIVYSIEVL